MLILQWEVQECCAVDELGGNVCFAFKMCSVFRNPASAALHTNLRFYDRVLFVAVHFQSQKMFCMSFSSFLWVQVKLYL
jgi:hypothetical protein